MDLTKGVPLERLKQILATYERYVRMGSGPYSTKRYRDILEFHKGAVWAVKCMIDNIEELIKLRAGMDEERQTSGRFEPQKGTHYTGD